MATTSFAVHVHTYFAYGGLTPRGSRHSQQDIAPGVSPTDRSKIRLLYELNGSQREQRVAPPPLPLSFVSAATNIEDYIDYYDSEDVKCALCNAYVGRVTAFTENPLVSHKAYASDLIYMSDLWLLCYVLSAKCVVCTRSPAHLFAQKWAWPWCGICGGKYGRPTYLACCRQRQNINGK